jgi:hypothetical protein
VLAQRGGDLCRVGAFGGPAGQAEHGDCGDEVAVQVGDVALGQEGLRADPSRRGDRPAGPGGG